MKCLWEWGVPDGVISYNHNGICTTICPDSSLPNTVDYTCDDCGPNCAVCSVSTDNCTVCQIGYVLNENKCISKCPPGKYPDTSNICQVCPSQCVLCEAASQCTKCLNTPGNVSLSFYFVNYQCVLDCPDRYYKDGSNPLDLFCRSCPSGCNQCTDENTCTVCDPGWYLDSFYSDTRKLCVNKCQPGFYPNNVTMTCQRCLTGCEKCDNSTHCSQCQKGLVLEVAATTTCTDSCADGTYPDAKNECQNCITGCKRCSNNYTCNECNLAYYLVDDVQNCVTPTCPAGYYVAGTKCLLCRPQCKTCSAALTCDTCIQGYEYKTGQCNIKCGNKVREDNEECDDGNTESDDGCTSLCKVEPGFVCMPLDTTTTGPDVCFCDAKFQSASWTAFWGTIEINFKTNIVFNTDNGPKSADAKIFCTQILDASLLPLLGTEYSCFLDASTTGSQIRINVDLDSTLGNNAMNFNTQVILIYDALRVKDCPTSIPLTYTLTNLPLDSPIVYFQSSHNGIIVPKCSSYWGLNIFTSKGFTKRNVAVQWILIAMQPDDSDLKQELQDYLDNNYRDVKYFEFLADQIERLAGKSLSIKAIVTNFLGIAGSNITTVQFSNMKSMLLVDLQDIYTFQTAVDNTLAPRIRIPYCSGEDSTQQENELKQVTLSCTLYSDDQSKKTPLTNCTIQAFNMTLGQPYKVLVKAVNLKDPNMGIQKWVHIDTASPNARIAYINGCNRLFSVLNSFDLEAMIPTNVSFAKFNWYCTDTSTGSPCFTTTFSYITMANTKRVTIPGGQLFANNTYLFKVIVFDQLSQTQTTKECNMYAAPQDDQVLDIVIDTEANRNGFIDFNAQMAAFKVQMVNNDTINRNLLSFKWKFTDSSGTVFSPQDLSIYQNSLGVLISKLERSNIYKVETNATYGQKKGYIRTFYDTEPQMSFEFSVEPPVGEPHKTVFTFSVTSQDTLDGLYQYVFGYVNPVDKISNIPIYQKSTNRYQRTQLPVPEGQTYLTCYVQVMLPSGESKTYQQNVTMTTSTITVEDFKQQLNSAVMDDLVESMQIKNKLVTLGPRMTLADRSLAIRKILKGLQSENTPLSDYNIQSSVASLLEYISKETESIMTDAQVVTVAAAIFQQITIGENKDIANGRYSQFGRAATFSLYNFANNLFQKDFSSVIGGQNQLQMKVMFMKGLKNILKGSLSNQILGDIGGFSYQGQNIYVKAVKYDQLESMYKLNASLPQSLAGTLSQNYVNLSLPQTASNPCLGRPACQVSIIILDTPVNAFLSNSKDSKLMSMFVDTSLQETEVSSPFSWVSIKDLDVKNLQDPIQMTIPLLHEFTDTSNNRTLGCGYLDETDQIFKADGVKAVMINRKLVTCQASHLTAIGVEEYAVEQQSIVDDTSVVVAQNTTTQTLITDQSLSVVDMWGSWAVYMAFILLGILGLGAGWGYTRDKRDEINLRKVLLNKEKIYMNLFLEPLPDDALHNEDDDQDDYDALQEEKARQAEARRQRQLEKESKYRGKVDENAPVKGLFSPEEMLDKFGVDVGGQVAKKKAEEEARKKKKKKKKVVVESDLFFEGGENGILPEYNSDLDRAYLHFEGGDEEEEGKQIAPIDDEEAPLDLRPAPEPSEKGGAEENAGEDEAAASIKVKGKKGGKKKKKKGSKTKTQTALKELDTIPGTEAGAAETLSPKAPGELSPTKESTIVQQQMASDGLLIEDIDGKSVKSKKSKKSLKKRKSTKSKEKAKKESTVVAKDTVVPPEEEIKFNDTGFGGFQFNANAQADAASNNGAAVDVQPAAEGDETNKSRKSKKGSKRKGRGQRSSSAHRQRQLEEDQTANPENALADEGDNLMRPDIEAEEISPTKPRRGAAPIINREELFMPIAQLEGVYVNNQEFEDRAAKSEAAKTIKKKSKKKKKKKAAKQEDEEEEEEEEEEPEEEKKANHEEDDEPSGACQFCFWNFREGHRCLSFFSYYNDMISRPVRFGLLVMSWYLFMTFSGYFMGGNDLIAKKQERLEQLICGSLAALFARPWVLAVTYFVMQHKPSKVQEMIQSKIKAKNVIRANRIKFYIGLTIVAITIIYGFAEAFNMSSTYQSGLVQNWAWAYLFSILADFVLVDGLFMTIVTMITVNVGATPDACGRRRAFWLKLVPPAIKDSIE